MDCAEFETLCSKARDHAINPRNYGPPDVFNGHARITGPCGDTMEFWLTVQNGRIHRIFFTTDGCGPSLASGSMATILGEGKRIKEAAYIGRKDILEALGGLPSESEHCALLAADTLKAACQDYLEHLNAGRDKCSGGHDANEKPMEKKQ